MKQTETEGFILHKVNSQLKIWLDPKPKFKYYVKYQENQYSSKLYVMKS